MLVLGIRFLLLILVLDHIMFQKIKNSHFQRVHLERLLLVEFV